MSYLVLARKWRPQTFEEVIGQKPITQALQNAIARQRVAHAYLFAGPRGVGKTSVARILAKALNCQDGPTPQPCDRCAFCQEIRTGIAVDVVEIDGASNRGIDEIRELRENVRYLPAKNKFKVYIIDEVHMLTDQAFNALLKTLEEPPPHVIFIFATTEPHKIPLTILSRCQRYNFKRIPLALNVEQLKKIAAQEGMEISDRSLHLLAREAEGSLRDGQSLLDQVLSFGGKKVTDEEVNEVLGLIDRKVVHGAIKALADGDKIHLLQIVEEIHNFGYDLKEFCGELGRLARDLLVLKVFPKKSIEHSGLIDLPEDEIQELSSQVEKFSLEEIHSLFRSLLAAHDEVARSAFPRLVLEMTLTRVARRKPIFSVEEALERLRVMEERLRSGQGSSLPLPPQQPMPPVSPPSIPAESITPTFGHSPTEEEEQASLTLKGNEGVIAPPAIKNSAETPGVLAGEINDQWKEFVQFAKRKKPPLASLLEHGYPLIINAELLEIGYPQKSFYLERMQEADNRSVLSTLCAEFFQRKMKVRVAGMNPQPLSPNLSGNGPEENHGRKNSKKNQQEEALNHPLVKEAINIFGGRVVEIKLL
jgi:DNA polymerase-3 subunit gamma/tau